MKFISFNINGLRARPHQLEAIIERYQPDVIGLQEIKVADEAFPYEITEKLRLSRISSWSERSLWRSIMTKQEPKSGSSWFSNRQ